MSGWTTTIARAFGSRLDLRGRPWKTAIPSLVLVVALLGTPTTADAFSGTTIQVGTNPGAMAANKVTNKIYVVNAGSGTVTMIDGAANTTTTINVGNLPRAAAVNPRTNRVYVTNEGDNTVTVLAL